MALLDILTRYQRDPAAARREPSRLPDVVALDRDDPLGFKRAEFKLPDGMIYLDGNSLGPMPCAAAERARRVVEQQWGQDLITSWNRHGWIDLPQTVGDKIAPLLGAAAGQVICCDSISVNLFKLLSAALALNPGRRRILSQADNFPTDLYVAQGLQNLLGAGQCEMLCAAEADLEAALDDTIAVLMLTQVNFRNGGAHNIRRLTRAAQAQGVLVLWDLAHSAGVMPLQLDQWNVDFAVGCGYKYLNGGPGAPAFIYAARRHHAALAQPILGWMGHADAFDFSPRYVPAAGMRQFLAGTPPVISMSVLDAALDIYRDIDLAQVRDKSLDLADYFAARVLEYAALDPLHLVTPLAHDQRGAQLAYTHPQAYAICQALIAAGVIADFRAPDILRFGFSPLYLRFSDIAEAVTRLAQVVQQGDYRSAAFNQRKTVT